LTTVAVFFPLVFVSGVAGELFKDQALTVSFALLFSLLVALTLIPMLSTLGVHNRFQHDGELEFADEMPSDYGVMKRGFTHLGRFSIVKLPVFFTMLVFGLGKLITTVLHYILLPVVWVFNKIYDVIATAYQPLLAWSLRNKLLIVLISLVSFGATLTLVPKLGSELIPQLSQGEFYADVRLAPGSPIQSTDQIIKQVQTRFADDKRIKLTSAVAGTGNRLDAAPVDSGDNAGRINVLINKNSAPFTEMQVRGELRAALDDIAGISYEFGTPEIVSFAAPFQVEIQGYDLASLKLASDQITTLMLQTENFADIRSTIITDSQKATSLGLNEREIADSIVNKVRGKVATKYSLRDRKIDVLIRSLDTNNTSKEELQKLIINPQSERPITLSAVAEIQEAIGPASINRVNQQRVAIITANIIDGDLGSAAANLQTALDQLSLPNGVNADIKGQSQEMQEAFSSMQFALLLAVFMVYLVMASQFESLIHPFVILFTIPMALIGSVLALFITGTTINVVALIGLIMLAGIVVNNGIVLIDLINQYRQKGLEKIEAIIQGGRDRLRPILMTAMTTILGLLPMALGFGEGAEIRTPMAITVIGGMLVATLLTLIVIPVVYSLLDNKKYSIGKGEVA